MTGRMRPAAASSRAALLSALIRSASGGPPSQDSDAPLAGEVRADGGEPAARHAERAEPAAVAQQSERGQADVAADAVEDHVHLARGLADP